jgi:hypothetical protein
MLPWQLKSAVASLVGMGMARNYEHGMYVKRQMSYFRLEEIS